MTSKKKASKINEEEKRGVGWWKRYEQPPLNDKCMNHRVWGKQRRADRTKYIPQVILHRLTNPSVGSVAKRSKALD